MVRPMGQDRSTPSPNDAAEQTILNYAFVTSSAEAPYPLPLAIPTALTRAPIASLRPIIVANLESEGIVLKQSDMRFWRTKVPLESEVAVNDWRSWFQRVSDDGERPFVAIPLTSTTSTCLKDSLCDDSLLHLLVTDGGPPFISDPATVVGDPEPRDPESSVSQRIALGTYYVGLNDGRTSGWRDVTEAERHSKVLHIPVPLEHDTAIRPALPVAPAILLGLRHLDIGSGNGETELMSHISDVYPDSFKINLSSFGRTRIFQARLSWMAIYPQEPSTPNTSDHLQWGSVDSRTAHPLKVGHRASTQRVEFRQGYKQVPYVFSCLSGFTIGGSGGRHWDIRTYVTSVDRDGFSLHIEKIRDSELQAHEILGHAQVSWLAFPPGSHRRSKMACGEFSLDHGVREENGDTVVWKGHIRFSEEFVSPPQVFVAFKSIDTDKGTCIRLLLDTENITAEGMDWKAMKWLSTTIYSATMAFFAVEVI